MRNERWYYTTQGTSTAYDIRVPVGSTAEEVEAAVRKHWNMDPDENVEVWPASRPDARDQQDPMLFLYH